MQKIIADNKDSDDIKFYQIKLIRVGKKKARKGSVKEGEEVMVQIQDVSLRIQS